eukprot:TRINITY_DN597_c0_g1_i1.p1 TRINITY_DN597_c0_g1~~TRINITY_DN597_c0_g1_i1.p1  ORF type:complete len:761 (-),score=68.21 TRINITY_DN597_c0_g1_i1:2661-4943(-)
MTKQRPVPLHTWQLDHYTLTPTACHLQAFENRPRPQLDPFVTLRFSQTGEEPQSCREFHVPASALCCSSPPFQALVTSGFLESSTHVVNLEPEAYPAFQIIVPFLKCEDIDMRKMPDSLPIYADRWGLDDLLDACFAYAETRRWPTFDRFMSFALPLMRFLRVPRTFKHVFAVRLGYGLDEVIDWFTGEEDYRIECLRSIPLLNTDSEASDYSPMLYCQIPVDGNSCPRPPRRELCGRYFCEEHYETEYLSGSPRYGGMVEDSSTPEPPSPSPRARKRQRTLYSRSSSLQNSGNDNCSSLDQDSASSPKKNSGSHCQTEINSDSLTNRKEENEAMLDILGNSSGSSPMLKTTSCGSGVNGEKPSQAASDHPSDVDGEKAVSLSPLSSWPETGAPSKPAKSATASIGRNKKSGKKRKQHPESQEREYAFWDAMRVQGILPKALKELIWYASDGYVSFILRGILHVLDNDLTEDEKVELLQILPWERKDTSGALGSNSQFTWRKSDWRIVAKAQARAAQVRAGGGEEYSRIIQWCNLIDEVCVPSASYARKCEKYEFMEGEDLSLYVSWRTRTRCDGEYTPLFLHISGCESVALEKIDSSLLDRPLDVSVSVREMDCSCEAGAESKIPIVPRMFYGLLRSDLKVRTLVAGPGLTYTIMDDFEMSRWIRRHQPSCGLVLSIRIRICDETREGTDIVDCSLERLGRGKCPCGFCLEDDISSEEAFEADVYSDASEADEGDNEEDDDEDESEGGDDDDFVIVPVE